MKTKEASRLKNNIQKESFQREWKTLPPAHLGYNKFKRKPLKSSKTILKKIWKPKPIRYQQDKTRTIKPSTIYWKIRKTTLKNTSTKKNTNII